MILRILNKPFPVSSWAWYRHRSVGFGLFVFLFLYLFKPFNLNFYNRSQLFFVSSMYGAIAGLVILAGGWVFIKWLMPGINEEKWTLGKQILWNTLLMLCITCLNVVATEWIHSVKLPLTWWVTMLGWVLMLGALPIAIAELVSYNVYLRQHTRSAASLSHLVQLSPKNKMAGQYETPASAPELAITYDSEHSRAEWDDNVDLLKHQLVLTGENQGDKLELTYFDLLAVQALDNYVNVFWEEHGQLRTTMLRNTLTNIATQLHDAAFIYRCHRGWLVNTQRVHQVDGNAQGLKLSVDLLRQQVPVSRANIPGFKSLTESLRYEMSA